MKPTSQEARLAIDFHNWILLNENGLNFREQKNHTTEELFTEYLSGFDAPTAADKLLNVQTNEELRREKFTTAAGEKELKELAAKKYPLLEFSEGHVQEKVFTVNELELAKRIGWIAAMKELPPAPQNAAGDNWISVEDRLPESGKNVLIYWVNDCKRGRTSIGYYAAKFSVVYMDDETNADYGEYSEEKDEYYFPEGWHENPQDIPCTSHLTKVIAWHPLPSPPTATAEQDKNNLK